jgi:hypothetical protein
MVALQKFFAVLSLCSGVNLPTTPRPSLKIPPLLLQPRFQVAKAESMLRAEEELAQRIMAMKPEVSWRSLKLELKFESKTDWKFWFVKKF